MISKNASLYIAIETLSEELRQAGEKQWGSSLDEALSVSTVPGEILGETRLQLQRLRSSEVAVWLSLQKQIDEALAYLDAILGPSRF